jgi:hypothetical protein
MKDFWNIQSKQPPKGFRAWLARKLIVLARRIAPQDPGVLADAMTEYLKEQMLHGIAGFRVLSAKDIIKGEN